MLFSILPLSAHTAHVSAPRPAVFSMAPPMPHDTIIEGLKQGNAVELELVTKMKEGLDLVTEGLMRECHNRSDALSELRERFQTVRSWAKSSVKLC